MSTWIDEKYLRLISYRLRNFKQRGRDVYNWSCHSCGDSKTNSRRARAYAFLNKSGKLVWTCHNCSDGGGVSNLVKSIDEDLFREMLMEIFQESDRGRELKQRDHKDALFLEMASGSTPVFAEEPPPELNPYDGLEPAVYLSPDHPCHQLLTRRKIPAHCWPDIFHTDGFYAWAHRLVPEKYGDMRGDEPRLVLPFTRGDRVIGFQGRSYGKTGAKYISGVIDKDAPFLYGWNRLDGFGDVLAVEGPIDSMFLRNGLATGGGSIQAELSKSRIPKEVCIIVYDNEPRNKHVVKNMLRAANEGWRVCVWPPAFSEKDVNEMVMAGAAPEQVQEAITGNAHAGMSAELAINSWKRVTL
jgi:hypothetical protein